MNHSLYQDEILKALPFKRLPWAPLEHYPYQDLTLTHILLGELKVIGWSLSDRFWSLPSIGFEGRLLTRGSGV